MSATVNFDLLRPTRFLIARAATHWGLGLEGNSSFTLFRRFQTVVGGPYTTKRIITVASEAPYTMIIGHEATATPKPVLAVEDYEDSGSGGIARFRDQGITQVGIYDATQTYQLVVSGAAYASGLWNTSDKKLKEAVKPLTSSLENIKKLKVHTYQFKKGKQFHYLGLPKDLQFGLIAQELKTVYPNLVRSMDVIDEQTEQTEAIKSINYIGLIPVLIAGIQDQQQLIEEKTKVTDQLKEQILDQQQQIDELRIIVENLLEDKKDEDSPSNSYILPLQQKATLSQNQPNPFHQNTVVQFFVPENIQDAKIQITALDGQVLGKLNISETGQGQLTIKAGTYPAGIYFYSLVLDGQVFGTKRMVLTR